jgi:opacity protein-like surface antigen
MRKILAGVVAAALLTAPIGAADRRDQAADVRPGAFVGARLQLPLGGSPFARPRAVLTVAPTQNRISSGGMVRTKIGEGLALDFTSERKPTLTLAGVRADTALTRRQDVTVPRQKAGISTGGWIAIGVGTVVVVGAVAFALWADAVNDASD